MEPSDGELVREARRGDKEAFRELVERYQRKIVSVALGMVHNHDDALEIAQETFVKAYENLGNFKGESSFYTWLYRIVVNRAIDFRRRERRHPTVGLDDRVGPADSGEVYHDVLKEEGRKDPYQQAQAHEIGGRVAEAIDELTPDHKAVILLREVEGLSYDEISRVMQCSKGTVMSRLHYARKKLQKRLKDCL
ncbi:MAG: sigma-70 family RNA polymerase sigma factor [Deltaproteobacteria bacterium]|nr:sigma-70 family RNA polymerase sigma factor [Deltaproteobacteria bacterium]